MPNDERCPWCGADATHRFGRVEFRCGSYPEEQSPICARVTKLEAALKRIADGVECSVPYASDHETLARHYYPMLIGQIENIARETLSDTHGPGTMAGDAARNALRADA